MIKELKKYSFVSDAGLYTFKSMPDQKLDMMIYLNDTPPIIDIAKKHILYFQNFYNEGSSEKIEKLRRNNYDGYIFISSNLQSMYPENSLYLPFGVDIELFNPKKPEEKFNYEVSYIGNDIKGLERTMRYIYPAAQFDFALYGNWSINAENPEDIYEYQRLFSQISKGKIPQEQVPNLYSSVKINLNCTGQDAIDNNVVTLRTYEVLACKGFLITDVNVGDLNECAVFTEGGKDLERKISEYLGNEQERNRLACNGYEYVQKNHTLRQRMKEFAEFIYNIS